MRRIVLAALLAAVAMPAWAANVDKAPASKIEVCKLAGGSPLCTVKHSPDEETALHNARSLLESCRDGDLWAEWFAETRELTSGECAEIRTYAKQRWGY